MRPLIFTILTIFHILQVCDAYSWNDYLSVDLSGGLNILLSAPHGGSITTLNPPARNRTAGCYIDGKCVYRHDCGTPSTTHCKATTVKDYQADEMARLLHREIYKLKNEYPKFVISNINRIKLDPNRARDEATFGETVPTIVYDWYHGNISAGIQLFGGAPGARGLVIDVHGYSTHSSSAAKWTLLGYAISKTMLNTYTDAQFDPLWNQSSIHHLAAAQASSKSFSCLLRRNCSFGAFMEAEGLSAVPAPHVLTPGSEKYYSGGYITKTYGQVVDTIQAEIHYVNRTPKTNREAFAKKFAAAIVKFYDEYFATPIGPGSVVG